MPGVDIGDYTMAYQVEGEGHDLVLLAGAFKGGDAWFQLANILKVTGFRVWRPDLRAHGSSPDVSGPLTYDVLADDLVKFIEGAVRAPVNLVGWGDGAVVTALVSMRRPDLVQRQAWMGQYFHSSGMTPEASAMLDAIGANPDFVRRDYDTNSPDGREHFGVVFDKTMQMLRSGPDFDLSSFSSVQADTLVLQGDRDMVTLEHSKALVDALPNGSLAVLPGGHGLPLESQAVVAAVLTDFLHRGRPQPSQHD